MRIYSGAWTRRSSPMMVSRANQGRRCWRVVALSHVDGSLCRRFMGHAWRWRNIAVGPYGTPQLLALIVAGALCDTAQCDGLHISISRPNGRRVDMPRTDAYEHNAKRYAQPHPRLFLFFKRWNMALIHFIRSALSRPERLGRHRLPRANRYPVFEAMERWGTSAVCRLDTRVGMLGHMR